MKSLVIRQFTAALLLCFVTTALAQKSAQIRLSDTRLAKSGISFAEIKAVSAAAEGIRLAGSVVYPPNRIEIISTPAAGVVQAVLVNSMDMVKSGQVLARLHSPELLQWQRDYVQQTTQLELATKKTERDESLFNEGIIAASRLQETRNQLQQSRVAVQERAQMLKLSGMSASGVARLNSQSGLNPLIEIRSHSGGSVLELMLQPGQRVEAGAALAKVARGGELWLELQASRAQGDQIVMGDTVKVGACKQTGKVTAIAPQMFEQSQLVIVRASLPGAEKCLRPGQYLEAAISSKQLPSSGWVIPSAALVRNGGGEFIFVRNAAGVKAVAVTVLTRAVDHLIVQGPLAAGLQVAVQGTVSLKGIWLGLGVSGSEAK